MKTERQRFAQRAYRFALAVTRGDQYMAWVGAAQAVIETGWGEQSALMLHCKNWLGIKPSRPLHPVRGNLRVFSSLADCWEAWAYLVHWSKHYTAARKRLHKHLNTLPSTPWNLRATYTTFAQDFVRVYCPANPQYPKTVAAIMREIDPFTLVPQEKRKRNWCSAAPDWLPCTGNIGPTACKPHDLAYAMGGSKADRLAADKALRERIYQQAKRQGNRWRGWLVAQIYYRAVRRFGGKNFE